MFQKESSIDKLWRYYMRKLFVVTLTTFISTMLLGVATYSDSLLQVAKGGSAKAQLDLSICYYFNRGITMNRDESMKWCKMAAEQGNDSAQQFLGVLYSELSNYEESVKWNRKAAEQGNSQAQCYLGDYLFNGKGIKKDQSEGVKWYTLSAEQGNADAQYSLGGCYYSGFGVPIDYKKAYKWILLACNNCSKEFREQNIQLRDIAIKKLTPEQIAAVKKEVKILQAKIDSKHKF
jgi:hypothetical protein